MRGIDRLIKAFLLTAWITAPAIGATMADDTAPLGTLGTVQFPTSARSAEAQAHFLRGVAALHSFWYPVALDEFRAAARLEPDFAMAYWGQAMTYNHPLWGDPQDTDAARSALSAIQRPATLTAREQAYLEAVNVLYGDGEKTARDLAYARAMEVLSRTYPDDREAATFHALALLGSVRAGDPSALRTRMRAAAIAQEVYRENRDHPGAAHYIIHAFDDPDHAILALHAARHYSNIAPPAHHAQHMPVHIFQQLGMWADASSANETAWQRSAEWVQQRHAPISQRDYHTLHWLLYSYVQQGRYRKAEGLITLMRQSLAKFPQDDARMLAYGAYTLSSMAAEYVVDTERWDAAPRLLPSTSETVTALRDGNAAPHAALAAVAHTPATFARGLAAAHTGASDADASVAALRAVGDASRSSESAIEELRQAAAIYALAITAVMKASTQQFDQAFTTMQRAVALEEASGVRPGPHIKPSHELYGELLLRAGRAEEATQQFARSLFRHPNRARSLLGAARAAARTGDIPAARHAYADLLQQWQEADDDIPARREAQEYLTRTSATGPINRGLSADDQTR